MNCGDTRIIANRVPSADPLEDADFQHNHVRIQQASGSSGGKGYNQNCTPQRRGVRGDFLLL
jgi:hypothetical protein